MMRGSNMGILPYGLIFIWSLGGFMFKHRCIHQREHSVTTLLTRLSCSNIGVFTKEDITFPGHPTCIPAASSSGNPDWPRRTLNNQSFTVYSPKILSLLRLKRQFVMWEHGLQIVRIDPGFISRLPWNLDKSARDVCCYSGPAYSW